jgi:hypothetical protein
MPQEEKPSPVSKYRERERTTGQAWRHTGQTSLDRFEGARKRTFRFRTGLLLLCFVGGGLAFSIVLLLFGDQFPAFFNFISSIVAGLITAYLASKRLPR